MSVRSSAAGLLRAVRPAPPPLGMYFRPSRNDHQKLLNLISAGDAACFGAVIEAKNVGPHTQLAKAAAPELPGLMRGLGRHGELKEVVLQKRLDAILDPQTQQLAFRGTFSEALQVLPWAPPDRPHVPDDFRNSAVDRILAPLADFVLEERFTQVLAPTHVISGADDPWLVIDCESVRWLRNRLDQSGGRTVPIIYSLALPYSVFRDPEQRRRILQQIARLPVSAIWLKVDRFGASSSPTAVLAYIEACSDLHALELPIISDHVGGAIGLTLLAFGATGGLVHGVTLSERFNTYGWAKENAEDGFSPPTRIYVASLDLHLTQKEAREIFSASPRAKAIFGCTDPRCCPRGTKDQLEEPARHFLYQRIKEVGALSQIPEQIRGERFLDKTLRPMTDKALAAANIGWSDEKLAKKTQKNRKRLDSLRVVLGHLASTAHSQSFAPLPKTRAAREVG